MPIGSRDFSDALLYGYQQDEYDLNEALKRPDGYVSYYNTGKMIFFEDFSSGFGQYVYRTNSSGNYTEIVGINGGYSPFALRFRCGAGSSNEPEYVIDLPFDVDSNYGYEIWFMAGDNEGEIRFDGLVRSPQREYEFILRYSFSSKKLRVRKANGSDEVITLDHIGSYPLHTFHNLKLIIDTVSGKYFAAILNGYFIDLTDYDIPVTTGNFTTKHQLDFKLLHHDSNVTEMWLSTILVTSNELEQ